MTKQIRLSGRHSDKFLIVDDEDYDEMSKYSWYLIDRGYPTAVIKSHQMVMKQTKRNGSTIIDHKNGNRLDCRKENLRFVTGIQNMQNKKGNDIHDTERIT